MLLLLKNTSNKRPFLSRYLLLKSPSLSPSTSTTSSYSTIPEFCNLDAKQVALYFKEWFKSNNFLLFDRIFQILNTHHHHHYNRPHFASSAAAAAVADVDTALSHLNLRISESFVLEVLKYGQRSGADVLSCLKFFDWAGRQPGFHHTRATFYAVFKILSKAKLMSVMLDFLESCMKPRWGFHSIRFYNTLVVGYAVAGKPYLALHVFGKMRYRGLDLDEFSYNVFLNALVEQQCFDAVDALFKQMSMGGLVSDITRSIMFKNLCKREKFDEAEAYLEGLASEGNVVDGRALGGLVSSLCKRRRFEEAARLLEKFRNLGMGTLQVAYGAWLGSLVRAAKLNGVLEFFKSKKMEGFVPDVFKYNLLVSRLLRENRLIEVFELLTEMKEDQILPDKVTMNTALCFFCKAGMLDVARELYKSRSEFGLSPNAMAYNFLVNTLCGDGSTEEAFSVLKNSFEQGFFPGKRTFLVLTDALCREKKLDKMKELLVMALRENYIPSDSTYDKFIKALCGSNMLDDGYLIFEEFKRMNKVPSKLAFICLIHGFNKSNRRDIAARLLIDMQVNGYRPTRGLVRDVICSLCDNSDMKGSEELFMQLLEMQLSHTKTDFQIYNFFIYGAGHAKRPDLARQVYDIMQRNGIEPNLSTNIWMLQSYLKSERISNALNFFNDFRKRGKIPGKLYNTMIVGLCKAKKADIALELLMEMRNNGMFPSNQCYEELIRLLCMSERFDVVVNLINELEKGNFRLTPFIGNVLLFHSLKTRDLFDAWTRLRDTSNETSIYSLLGQLIGVFSGIVRVDQDIEKLDEVIEQSFRLDTYTYNILLMLLSKSGMNHAYELYNRMCRKGYKPNQWTYRALIIGLNQCERTAASQRLLRKLEWKRDMLVQMEAHQKN